MNFYRQSKTLVSLLVFTIFAACSFCGCSADNKIALSANVAESDIGLGAEKFHDLCGQMLLFEAVNKALPKDKSELAAYVKKERPDLSEFLLSGSVVYKSEGFDDGANGRKILFIEKPSGGQQKIWTICRVRSKTGRYELIRMFAKDFENLLKD